ncbi:MAG TPA: metallophosphoesterase family protein [Thermoanaerobaculia bacterium]|nr:metallophosphoesterase family protein [Thermoanaerobaculia bacterium]
MRVGILSDTHGLLRPEVLELLAGSDRILHAGDVGKPEVLARLRQLAPVEAVRGNVDTEPELVRLPGTLAGHLGEVPFRLVHSREEVAEGWLRAARLVVYGHSHRPEISWHGGCLLLNPGACGPRRFQLPLTVARVTVAEGGRLVPEVLAVE